MKLKRIFGLLVLGGTILSTSAEAQTKKWTLEECIQYAIENNINLKRQEIASSQSEENFKQSKAELLPSVDFYGQHGFKYGTVLDYATYEYVDQNTQNGSASLSSDVTLFSGLQNYNNIKRTKYNYLSALANVDKAKNDLTLNISMAFLDILFFKEDVKLAEEQLAVTKDQIAKTEKLIQVGNAAKGDLLEIKSQAASEELALVEKRNNLKLATLRLTQLLNLEDASNFAIAIPEDLSVSSIASLQKVGSIYEEALNTLPEIQVAQYNVQSNQAYLNMQKGKLSPSLSLGVGYGSWYSESLKDFSTYSEQLKDNAETRITLSLQIPIFNKFRTKRNITNAKLSVEDAKWNLEEQKQAIYKTIEEAHAKAMAAYEKYNAGEEAVKAMQEAFKYTEQKYEVGLVDIIEYKIAKKNLSDAQVSLIQAKYDFIFRTKILEFYKNQQFTLN
jgi:outer membrane protein